MSWPRYWIKVIDGLLMIGNETQGCSEDPGEFLRIINETNSLLHLRSRFPAPRRQLIAALSALGYDFVGLVQSQIKAGRSNAELARFHGVDVRWIAKLRLELGVAASAGRPSVQASNEEIRAAYTKAESYSGGARLLGLDRRTFAKRYQRAVRLQGGATAVRRGSRILPKNE